MEKPRMQHGLLLFFHYLLFLWQLNESNMGLNKYSIYRYIFYILKDVIYVFTPYWLSDVSDLIYWYQSRLDIYAWPFPHFYI